MKLKVNNRTANRMFDGTGEVFIRDIATEEEMSGKNRCFIIIRLPKGASLGTHQHVHESEIYFILQGKGCYVDNDTEYEVIPGDAVICLDGDRHGIRNDEEEDLVFAALVVKL